MGRGQSSDGPSNLLTVTVLVLNGTCGIFGALLFSLAMWMRLETEVKDWVRELNMTQYWTGLYILMAAGAIIMIISFCGCCGALSENSCLLGTSAVLVLVALILELAGAIYLIINGTESSQLTPFLEKTFNKLMIDSNYNDQANRVLQVVQERIGCCGANNYQDYQRNNLPISDYCRDAVSGNLYNEGCVQQLSIFIEKRAGWLAGIAFFIGVLQMFLVCTTFCFWKNMPKPYAEVSQRPY